ncbi:MAG: glycosyltransferase [Tannerellaceae bacterium]|nr:glycosyltransferase [Tannerellaceae bacterium]
MRILLVTRGSQGDIYPYLSIAAELKKQGHEVMISLPRLFEELAKSFELNYLLQDDDINAMMDGAARTNNKTGHLLKWMRRVIDIQFELLTPIVEQYDLLIASNTEFAATSIAEYCGKPVIRTAFAPFIPGNKIPPPIMPFPKPHPVFKPAFLWKLLNKGTNFTVKKTINKNRLQRGMQPVKNFGLHAVQTSYNFLLFSRHLGSTDSDWNVKWDIGGYCFNDLLEYDKEDHKQILKFIRQDNRPTLFFTIGSCNDKRRNQFCEWLLHICKTKGYKLIVGSGWSKTGTHLQENDTLFLLTRPIPHSLIFPHCAAAIHHGGCGTTHSVARAGIPQFIVPLILDQHYWGYRTHQLGVGPESIKMTRINPSQLEKIVVDLMSNESYKTHAEELGKKIKSENGLHNFCRYIEKIESKEQEVKK